MLIDVKIFFLE